MRRTVAMLPMALLPVILLCGCGGKPAGGARMTVERIGFSMKAPAGWKVEKDSPGMCSRGDDSTGVVIDESLEGKEFRAQVTIVAQANRGRVVSTMPLSVAGCEAIEAVVEYPDQGSKSLKVYIHKGDSLVEVSFVTPEGEFDGSLPSLHDAVKSIALE